MPLRSLDCRWSVWCTSLGRAETLGETDHSGWADLDPMDRFDGRRPVTAQWRPTDLDRLGLDLYRTMSYSTRMNLLPNTVMPSGRGHVGRHRVDLKTTVLVGRQEFSNLEHPL